MGFPAQLKESSAVVHEAKLPSPLRQDRAVHLVAKDGITAHLC